MMLNWSVEPKDVAYRYREQKVISEGGIQGKQACCYKERSLLMAKKRFFSQETRSLQRKLNNALKDIKSKHKVVDSHSFTGYKGSTIRT